MRVSLLFPLILVAGCSSQVSSENVSAGTANAAASANMAAVADAAPAAPGMRGGEPATSASAAAAKALVEKYYALIKQKKYAAARKLWSDNGAASGGDAVAFAKTITPYLVYEPKVGAPTEIKVAGDMQYVNVAATLHVQRRSNKAVADRDGVVMLHRSIDPNDKNVGKRDWTIRGVDIRVHN